LNLHSFPLLNRVSLYSFPLSYNLPEGFNFRSLHYMIFYFLKELFASPSRIRFIFFHFLRRDQTFIFCPPESLRLLFLLLAYFRSLSLFCYSLTSVNFLFVFPSCSLSVSAFFFPSFRECKGRNLFLFSKTFFSFFYSKFCSAFPLSSLPPQRAAKV
jgi:hypothetical protein